MLQTFYAHNHKPTARDIRRANRLAVLHQLLAHGPMSRQELSRRCDLSLATVCNVIADLLNEGIVVESGLEESQGGRPGMILALNAGLGVVAGVDVAETYIHFELFDLALHRLGAFERHLSPDENQPEQIVGYLVTGLEALLARSGVPASKLVGAGISVPGPFEHTRGVSVFAPNWGWRDVPLMDMLAEQIHVPLYLDNPLKFNVIAESWFGAGRGVQNLVALVLGTGVGAGLVINGTLHRGISNSAGEWGHTTIVFGGRQCRCGSRGCVEAYVGAPGIILTLREFAPGSEILTAGDQTAVIAALAEAARRGDAVAQQALRQTAEYLGAGIANVINLLNPEMIVLGSWVGLEIGPLILADLERAVERYALKPPLRTVRIVVGQALPNAVSTGAGLLALDQFLAESGSGTNRRRRQSE